MQNYLVKIIQPPFQLVCMYARSLQSCLTFVTLTNCGPPGSSVHGILQARILEWVAMTSSRHPPNPGIKATFHVSYIGRQVLCH